MDLFDIQHRKNEGPLAARMRPRNLDEYIGQDHIVGKGRLLRRAIAADQLTSVIFTGLRELEKPLWLELSQITQKVIFSH